MCVCVCVRERERAREKDGKITALNVGMCVLFPRGPLNLGSIS